jgi:hypothetical protein
MRLLGASADFPQPVLEEVKKTAGLSLPFFVWSDGDDLTAVVADDGDQAADVQRVVKRYVPEFAA